MKKLGTTARLAGNGLFGSVLAFNWLPGVFLLACIGVVAGILKRQGSPLAKQFFLFPLVVWPNPRPPQPRFEIEFALGVLGFSWLCELVLLFKDRFRPDRAAEYKPD